MVIAATNERPPQGKIKFTLKIYILLDSFRLFYSFRTRRVLIYKGGVLQCMCM